MNDSRYTHTLHQMENLLRRKYKLIGLWSVKCDMRVAELFSLVFTTDTIQSKTSQVFMR
jgi:hypothetical protein